MRRRPGECDGRVPRGIASRGYARAGAIPACSRGRVFQLHPATTVVVVAVGNPHRATSSSRRIPSRRARAVVHGTHDASRDTSVAPSGPERVAAGGPRRGPRRNPPIAAGGRTGDARNRDDATTWPVRGRGIRKVNTVGWHSPCLLRSTLRASATRRQVKRGGVRCWRCSCISSRWKSILRFSALFSHTGPVRDSPIKQLNTDSLLLHYERIWPHPLMNTHLRETRL